MNVRDELRNIVLSVDEENTGLITKSREYNRLVGLIEYYEEHGETELADTERETLRRHIETYRDKLTPSRLNVGDTVTICSHFGAYPATVDSVTPQTVTVLDGSFRKVFRWSTKDERLQSRGAYITSRNKVD